MTDFTITTRGLEGTPDAASEILAANWAVGAGTANAITAVYDPENTSLPDGLILGVRISLRNTSTTPTFSPDGLTARTIKKQGALALEPGDLTVGHEALLRYVLATTHWELLNPCKLKVERESKVTVTGNKTLALTDCGIIQDVNTDAVVITLLATVAGAEFIIRNAGTSDGQVGVYVSPNASDKIAGNGFTATDNKDAINTKATAKVGDLIRIVGDGTDGWKIAELIGTWDREA